MDLGIPLYADDGQIPTFHPVHHRETGAWQPANEAAHLLVHIHHIWDDITTINGIRSAREDVVEKRLLFKYIIVELRSLFDPLERLQAVIMGAEERSKANPRPWRSISRREKDEARRLFKAYYAAKRVIEADVYAIRNNIGAHRPRKSWQDIMMLWDKIEPALFIDLLNTIPPIFNFAAELDLYEWARTPSEGIVQILGARLRFADLEEDEGV